MVIDLYTAVVLEAANTGRIPQSSWDDINLFVPQAQRVQIKKNELFPDLVRHSINRIFAKDLAQEPSAYVMLLRPWMRADLEKADCIAGARFAYSMWGGYLDEPYLKKFQSWLDEKGIPMSQIHTSGHAPVKDLKRFAAALAPGKLVPIHSFETGRFGEFFDNVETKDDGVWWEV